MASPDNFTATHPPLVVTRVLRAPRATVFRAWSSAEHVKRWFAPEGFSVPEARIDFRPGGAFEVCMRSPDGQDFWSRGHYLEVVGSERLVFQDEAVVEDVARFRTRTTVTLEDAGSDTTRLTVRQEYELLDADFAGAIKGAPEGWRTTLDRLEQEVVRMGAGRPA